MLFRSDAVRPYNVRLFIGGHYHSNRDLRYDGIPGVLMRSNLRDKEGKPGYGIYEVTKDSICEARTFLSCSLSVLQQRPFVLLTTVLV